MPICSVTRTKYGIYPEYHTSFDDFTVISEQGLEGSVDLYKKIIRVIESNCVPEINVLCEPQLGKRGLYPNISTSDSGKVVREFMNFISYCDGTRSILELSSLLTIDYFKCLGFYEKLSKAKLLK